MAQPQTQPKRQTPATSPMPHLCTVEDCHEPAIAAYRWDWGEEGKCCGQHQFLLRQKAEPLQRGIQFAVLDPNATPALTRDERTQFHAKVLTLEDELRDAKSRGLELYQSNTRIAEEARRLAARNRELEAQMKDAHASIQAVTDERDEYRADLADARTELERLQAILPKAAPADKSTQPPEK
jgi:chromosome segregation ATPase